MVKSPKFPAKGHVSGWVFGLLGVGTLVFAVLHFGDLESFGAMLRHAQPIWLVAAGGLQIITYTSVSLG